MDLSAMDPVAMDATTRNSTAIGPAATDPAAKKLLDKLRWSQGHAPYVQKEFIPGWHNCRCSYGTEKKLRSHRREFNESTHRELAEAEQAKALRIALDPATRRDLVQKIRGISNVQLYSEAICMWNARLYL